VSSSVSNGYVRSKLPDGSFGPETYTFREGGYLSGRLADDTIDKMTFESVTRAIAGPLASRNYWPSTDPKAAKLLIVVYWGTTRAPAETAMATPAGQDMETSGPPGPQQPLNARGHPPPSGTVPLREGLTAGDALAFGDKMINEEDGMMLGYGSVRDPDLKQYRYFVILLAYDLPALLRDKKEKLLWQTRLSINQHRNQFDAQLKSMVLAASVYFGRDSFGLKHDPVPEGHVEIGDVRSLETVLDPNSSAVLSPNGARVAYLTKSKNGLDLAIADIDQQEFHSTGDIPNFDGQPVQLTWLDAGHVVLRLPSSEQLVFNDQGTRVDFNPQNIDPGFAGFSRAASDDASSSQVQGLVEGKLPDRKVVILGSDKALRRFLLIASEQTAAGRYFVYDRPNDLLYEIGRSVPVK
jgi:hypothetical protein